MSLTQVSDLRSNRKFYTSKGQLNPKNSFFSQIIHDNNKSSRLNVHNKKESRRSNTEEVNMGYGFP